MEIPLEWKSLARVSIRPSPLVPALVHVVGGPTRAQVAGVGSTPIVPALDLYLLPASLLKLLLFPSLHLIQSGTPRHHPSRIGILPAPLADMGRLRQEADLLQRRCVVRSSRMPLLWPALPAFLLLARVIATPRFLQIVRAALLIFSALLVI